jgi:hypothetical protein
MSKNIKWLLLGMLLSFQVNAASVGQMNQQPVQSNDIDNIIAQQQKDFGKLAEQSKTTVERNGVATHAIRSINDAVQKTQMLFETEPKSKK